MAGFAIVIPARRGSTRFFNKPMVPIAGRPMIERTVRIAQAAPGVAEVLVATDCETISQHCKTLGAKTWVSQEPFATGSERVARAADELPSNIDVVVNLQGDAPLTPPDVIGETAQWLLRERSCLLRPSATTPSNSPWGDIAAFVDGLAPEEGEAPSQGLAQVQQQPRPSIVTAAVGLDRRGRAELVAKKASGDSSGTTVVVDRAQRALFFSRAVLPHQRHRPVDGAGASRWEALRHMGLYAFAREALGPLTALSPTPLEQVEGLEQLRWLEHGWPIHVGIVDMQGRSLWSVDFPEDVAMVEAIIGREGELVTF